MVYTNHFQLVNSFIADMAKTVELEKASAAIYISKENSEYEWFSSKNNHIEIPTRALSKSGKSHVRLHYKESGDGKLIDLYYNKKVVKCHEDQISPEVKKIIHNWGLEIKYFPVLTLEKLLVALSCTQNL